MPQYHDLNHWALVVTFWGGSTHGLKSYQCNQQRFPLKLSPGGETEQTKTFSHLVAGCAKSKLCKQQGNDWISDKTWALVGQQMALRLVAKLLHAEGRWTKHLIWASLRNNRVARMKGVSDMIEAELAKGDVQEAFCLLKGWYRAASETVARPCPQTMARQTEEWVELYQWRDSPGQLLPINLQGPAIPNEVPSDHKIRDAARDLMSGRGGGGHQKCTRRTSKDGYAALRCRRTPRRGPTTLGKETTGASLSASSRLFGGRVKSQNN